MEKRVKLLVCYHKPDYLLKDDVLTPIHVGRALAKESPNYEWMKNNMIGDDTGENISKKNSSYNELTALYWAWKNYESLGDPDYIGLMHYRRHFIFRKSNRVVEDVYKIENDYFDYINYSYNTINHLFDDCDYIAHIGHVDKVYKHYKENHHIEDLDLALKILKEKYPDYSQVADDYMDFSYGNFCNMFILPKKLFFEYCEWIFNILEEFEKQVDLTNKRLFISERLTGIFIESLQRKGYKQKSLSTTFIKGDVRIPVALPYDENYVYATAVTIVSILRHRMKGTCVDFFLLGDKAVDKNKLSVFDEIIEKYKGNTISFIDVKKDLQSKKINCTNAQVEKIYPILLPKIFDKINKIVYLDNKSIFFGDIAGFFQTCNNDEFDVLGLPNKDYTKLQGNAFALNLKRLRSNKILNSIKDYNAVDLREGEYFNKICGKQAWFFPWWLYNVSRFETDNPNSKNNIYRNKKFVWERPLLYYEKGLEPWKNIQGAYTKFWWESAECVPASVRYDCPTEDIENLMYQQSAQLCMLVSEQKSSPPDYSNDGMQKIYQEQTLPPKKETIKEKIKRYYKEFGFWATVKQCFKKLVKR